MNIRVGSQENLSKTCRSNIEFLNRPHVMEQAEIFEKINHNKTYKNIVYFVKMTQYFWKVCTVYWLITTHLFYFLHETNNYRVD